MIVRKNRVVKKCKTCGAEFEVIAARSDKAKYCSVSCRAKAPRSDVFKESMSKRFKGSNSSSWRGGRKTCKEGYVYIYRPNHPSATKQGYVLEHRLVMEEKLGRMLRSWEIVHHKNGIVNDNRPENLTIMSRSQHVKHHDPGKDTKFGVG